MAANIFAARGIVPGGPAGPKRKHLGDSKYSYDGFSANIRPSSEAERLSGARMGAANAVAPAWAIAAKDCCQCCTIFNVCALHPLKARNLRAPGSIRAPFFFSAARNFPMTDFFQPSVSRIKAGP